MGHRREKEPFITKGDKILMHHGGMSGLWNVLAARWARREDEGDERIEIVIGRGTGLSGKIIFNPDTMRHYSQAPAHVTARDIHVRSKPFQFRAK